MAQHATIIIDRDGNILEFVNPMSRSVYATEQEKEYARERMEEVEKATAVLMATPAAHEEIQALFIAAESHWNLEL